MSVNVDVKKNIVKELQSKLENAQTIVLAEYRGLNMSSMTELREQARSKNVYLKVLKNTLFKRAIKGSAFESLSDSAVGPLIYSISEDPINAAKILNSFSKNEENIKIKVGSFNGQSLNFHQVVELASIPAKEELLSKLLGVMQSPLYGFARLLLALANKKQEEFLSTTDEIVKN